MLDTYKKQAADNPRLSKMFELIECVKIGGISRYDYLTTFDSKYKWADLFELSAQHGVLAIVYDAVKSFPKECQPPRKIKLKWALSAEIVERRYRKQLVREQELAQIYSENGIKTIVLKGLAISGYYPIPEHRECGDFDCFLVKKDEGRGDATAVNSYGRPISCYNEGNQVANDAGADIKIGYYKHSHINYKGLIVENHLFCTAIRGSRDRKSLEKHLQTLLVKKPLTRIDGSYLHIPCADFNALFLTVHGLEHFLSEGIKLRHILDWALLLKAEQENINWSEFYYWTDKMNMTRFANVMTAIAVQYLGLEITNPAIQTSSPYIERVLEDTFKSEGLHNKGYSTWVVRFLLIVNKLSFSWKFHKIYQKSIIVELARSIIAFLIERNPKL